MLLFFYVFYLLFLIFTSLFFQCTSPSIRKVSHFSQMCMMSLCRKFIPDDTLKENTEITLLRRPYFTYIGNQMVTLNVILAVNLSFEHLRNKCIPQKIVTKASCIVLNIFLAKRSSRKICRPIWITEDLLNVKKCMKR